MKKPPAHEDDAGSQASKRKALSKGMRFDVFRRDGYKCRYCGRDSTAVILEVDHIIPVAEGGTNDEANLITSCFDCNRGKGVKSLFSAAPTEMDRLRIAQERQEIIAAANLAKKASAARDELEQGICDFWCESNNVDSMSKSVLRVLCSFARQHGVQRVFEWIQVAADRLPGKGDSRKGRYISGIRRRLMEEGEI